ncbi:unnamed protein product [Rhizoctonia solani]|uniref:Uncharacterized protein n=1 Tax=Rhizoctonia solani TaxID=456999 RepID=A0A8H3BVZ5_9AGAM|nr:unnamed protein product [Rhizoctonia solani]
MLRTCLIQSRIIANGTPLYGFYLRRPRLCIAGKALHNKAPPPSNLGSSPPINPPHDLQFPNSFVELVEFARSVEKARKMAVDENGSNFEPNKGKGKGKKKKKKSQAKGDKSEKQKSRSEHEEGNEHIVTALIEAINKDYWPDIIYYSTLHPQHLQG